MKKILSIILTIALTVSISACGPVKSNTEPSEKANQDSSPVVEKKGIVLMATTTSTDDTGLLDYLAPKFLKTTGYELQWTAVGTGDAIKKGEDGLVDVILVHAKAKEEAFVEAGFGVERFQVMYNDFIIVGPKGGVIEKTDSIEAVFKKIKEDEIVFISRGDNSGTHTKETGIWKAIGVEDYEANKNYVSAGSGMGDTLAMADEMSGYCLTDRGTWLAKRESFKEMEIICEGDKNLSNQYGIIAVNPEKYPDVNNDGANAFIEWINSGEIQKMIGEFGVDKYAQPLFFPNANK